MRKTHITLGRRSVQAAAIASLAFSFAHGQIPQPAITLAKSPNAQPLTVANDRVSAGSESFGLRTLKDNYREFTRTKIAQPSEPELFTFEFHTTTTLGAISANGDFRVSGGTCIEGHVYVPGNICNIDVVFTPRGPGHRTGQLSVVHSAVATPFLVPLGGPGYGPAVSFIPSQMATLPGTYTGGGTTFAGNLLSPQELAVDGGDSLYIADTGNNLIKFMDSSGTISTLVGGGAASAVGYSGFGSGIKLTGPRGVAVDYSGTFYIADTGDSVVLVRYIDGIINTRIGGGATASNCSFASPCLPYNVKITPPYSIATDSSGNVYTALQVGGSLPGFYIAENEADNNNYYLLNTTAYNYYSTSPSIGVDADSNLFYTYEDPGGPLLSPTPLCYILAQNRAYSTSAAGQRFWTVAGSGKCGFSGDGGKATGAEISTNIGQFAWDPAGNFYFADTGNNRIRRVDALTGVIRTVAGNGTNGYYGDGVASTSAAIQAPTGLAVDSNGRVYTTGAAAYTQNATAPLKTDLRTFGLIGQLNFVSQATSTHSAAQTVLISNVGNDTLNFTHVGFSSGATTDYAIDPNTTSCNFTAPLYSGQSCSVGIIFTPTAVGARAAVLSLLDDTVSGINTIQLSGTGATTATVTPASLAFGPYQVNVASAAQTVVLKNTGTALLTISSIAIQGSGLAAYSKTTTCGTTLAAASSCNISVVFKPATLGALAASLVVTDNAVGGQQTVALTGTGAAAAHGVITPISLAFASQTVGTSSAAKAITLSNTGGVPLTISSYTFTGTNASDFAQTHTCAASLAGASNCSISVAFKPVAAGARTAALSIVTSTGTLTATLSGTSVAAAVKPKVTLTSSSNPSPRGQPILLTSNVVAVSAAQPTGVVQLKEGRRILAEATLTNGLATFRLYDLATGAHVLNAVYLGDKQHEASTSAAVRQMVGLSVRGSRHATFQ